jgi:hypothetical protein
MVGGILEKADLVPPVASQAQIVIWTSLTLA